MRSTLKSHWRSVAHLSWGLALLWLCSERVSFHLDADKEYWIEFGRGSGWHGLDTIKIGHEGSVILHRYGPSWPDSPFVEVGSLTLAEGSLAEVLKAVEDNRLLALDRAYHANIHDGTQWVLLIRQGDHAKSVYFNNQFPDRIVRFADTLDRILAENGLDRIAWRQVPRSHGREHERGLRDSIERKQ